METELDLTASQKNVLQILNGFDALVVGLTIVFAVYNIIKFVIIGKIRRIFIVVFYKLTLFCLISWETTAIAQTVDPTTQYLVF